MAGSAVAGAGQQGAVQRGWGAPFSPLLSDASSATSAKKPSWVAALSAKTLLPFPCLHPPASALGDSVRVRVGRTQVLCSWDTPVGRRIFSTAGNGVGACKGGTAPPRTHPCFQGPWGLVPRPLSRQAPQTTRDAPGLLPGPPSTPTAPRGYLPALGTSPPSTLGFPAGVGSRAHPSRLGASWGSGGALGGRPARPHAAAVPGRGFGAAFRWRVCVRLNYSYGALSSPNAGSGFRAAAPRPPD